MPTPGVEYRNGRKTFITLENNPDVFSRLSRSLDVSDALSFHDIFAIDPDDDSNETLSYLPRPINALIFLCAAKIYYAARTDLEASTPTYTGHGPSEPIIWVEQTIGNACGLMAYLHCILNLEDGIYITPGTNLDTLRTSAIDLPPKERAQLLYDSVFLEEAHMDAAGTGDSAVPSALDHVGNHFIGFVKKDGKVWELNGGMPGPVERGFLGEEDLLSKKGLELSIGDFLDAAKRVDGLGLGISIVGIAGER